MANTTADIPRVYEAGVEPIFNDIPMEASLTVYEGAAVGVDPASNLVESFVTATSNFVGFAEAQADNSSGAASALNCKVRSRGIIRLTLTVTGAGANVEVGDAVYAADDQTFDEASSSQERIGTVHRVLSTATNSADVMVYFEAQSLSNA